MELEDLKQVWIEQNHTMNQKIRLNSELLQKTTLDKARHTLSGSIWVSILTFVFYMLVASFFMLLTIKYWNTIHLTLAALTLTIWATVLAIGAIHQLYLAKTIDYAKPITEVQRQLEVLKLVSLKYVRLIQWIIPLYFAFIVVGFKYIFDFDIVANASTNWLYFNLGLSLTLIPVSLWFHQKLQPKNSNKKWMKAVLGGSGNYIIEAIDFLDQVDKFKKSEVN